MSRVALGKAKAPPVQGCYTSQMIFFNSWADLGRVLLVGPLAYLTLLLMLRASGKRTLSKLNAFDFIVTVALGSVLASTLLSKDVALAESVVALAVLIFGQFVITYLSVRSERFQELVKGEPTLLYYKQRFLEASLKRARVSKEEIRAAVRASGQGSLEQVGAVVLETDGSLSVVGGVEGNAEAWLVNVAEPEEA